MKILNGQKDSFKKIKDKISSLENQNKELKLWLENINKKILNMKESFFPSSFIISVVFPYLSVIFSIILPSSSFLFLFCIFLNLDLLFLFLFLFFF